MCHCQEVAVSSSAYVLASSEESVVAKRAVRGRSRAGTLSAVDVESLAGTLQSEEKRAVIKKCGITKLGAKTEVDEHFMLPYDVFHHVAASHRELTAIYSSRSQVQHSRGVRGLHLDQPMTDSSGVTPLALWNDADVITRKAARLFPLMWEQPRQRQLQSPLNCMFYEASIMLLRMRRQMHIGLGIAGRSVGMPSFALRSLSCCPSRRDPIRIVAAPR